MAFSWRTSPPAARAAASARAEQLDLVRFGNAGGQDVNRGRARGRRAGQGHLATAACSASRCSRCSLSRSQQASFGQVGRVRKTGCTADYNPDPGAPVVAGTDVLDPAVVERNQRPAPVLGEYFGELSSCGQGLTQHPGYDSFVDQWLGTLSSSHRRATLPAAPTLRCTTASVRRSCRRYRLEVILETINGPSDLRRLDYEELTSLAAEIREFIVQAVSSANSGHLGSNLGVVELTLALAPCFQFAPRLCRLGHRPPGVRPQAGDRAARDVPDTPPVRGLSGYPSRAESVHDWVENSHASTALCYAHGLAAAVKRSSNPNRNVVAVVGDGALTGGMATRASMNLGHSDSRVIVILNDNGRSYAPTVSRLSESLTRLRLHPGVSSARRRIESRCATCRRSGASLIRACRVSTRRYEKL